MRQQAGDRVGTRIFRVRRAEPRAIVRNRTDSSVSDDRSFGTYRSLPGACQLALKLQYIRECTGCERCDDGRFPVPNRLSREVFTMATLLVPVDFSDNSLAALEHAETLARDRKAKLLIAHVHELEAHPDGGFGGFPMVPDDLQEEKARLESIRPADAEVRYEHRLMRGAPATEIVRLADEEGVELIVLGTHGRTGLMRLLLGSVAESVVRKASCPVLTVKHPAHEHPTGEAMPANEA